MDFRFGKPSPSLHRFRFLLIRWNIVKKVRYFLTYCFLKGCMQESLTPLFKTSSCVPQWLVIRPHLLHLFIKDLFYLLRGEVQLFADNVNIVAPLSFLQRYTAAIVMHGVGKPIGTSHKPCQVLSLSHRAATDHFLSLLLPVFRSGW